MASNATTPNITPMMAQYLEIKEAHSDSLLFFRMGDFYEMFFDDAVAASGALDIALTKRGKHEGSDIPMCGVPVHSHQTYLQRLIKKGFRVAICEQIEDPAEARKRPGKVIVKRAVERIITPGTLTEETLLDARSNNHLVAFAQVSGETALAWIDVSTGSFWASTPPQRELTATLSQLSPGEILVADSFLANATLSEVLRDWSNLLTTLPIDRFESLSGERQLKRFFRVASLEPFGAFHRAEVAACGALLTYLELTQKGRLPRLSPPRRQTADSVMAIDAATRRNLEITVAADGGRTHSLLGAIDRTLTGPGARLLSVRLSAPLTQPSEINKRLDMVDWFLKETKSRMEAREILRSCPDIERSMGRLALERGGPRDLAAIRDALVKAKALKKLLTADNRAELPEQLSFIVREFDKNDELIEMFAAALAEELPMFARDGDFISPEYSGPLDEHRFARDESRRLVRDLEKNYREKTGVNTLKVKHNNILGYFVEVTPLQSDKIPSSFIHRQTLASAVRFTTTELGGLEQKIKLAGEMALSLELKIFDELVESVVLKHELLGRVADGIAQVDVAAGLAELAGVRQYVRPLIDSGRDFTIVGGRHPVVEGVAEAQVGSSSFIANDCKLFDEQRIWLLTGPNMAGKSTFLRQNALIALLGQMGSFVPAVSARFGVVDRLFSRVGASDDLARGRSTFMVEMVETAAILNQAGPNALVVLDEIGRGTATYDGLSIAWATIEYLHNHNCCRALFATHFHELTALTTILKFLSCYHMKVREWEDEVVFLYEVGPGAADRSYGIQVARLAGLPDSVLDRAREVLAGLEREERGSQSKHLVGDMPLFSASSLRTEKLVGEELTEHIQEINPDLLSPMEALELIYKLKHLTDQ